MNEQQFKKLYAMAERCESDYQRGYRRGLRRHYHGENFGDPGEHEKWMALDGHRAEMGRGYLDGFAGNPPELPSIEDELDSYIHAACSRADKSTWVRAAQVENLKLTAWINRVLNAAAEKILKSDE